MRNARRILIEICSCAAVFAIALIFAYAVFACSGFAVAQDEKAFVISTADGDDWTLSAGGDAIETARGPFFDPMDKNAVSAKFLEEIKSRAGQDYTLRFELPPIGIRAVGDTVFKYTQSPDRGVLFESVFDAVISTDIIDVLQYRQDGGEFEVYPDASSHGDGLVFGQNVSVGDYDVRYVVYENFDLDGRAYSVPRYSSDITCTVKRAEPEVPQLPAVEVEYGATAAEIAWRIPDVEGSWTLSQNQLLQSVAKDTLLDASDDVYVLKFDYTPFNENYAPVIGVEVDVRIRPKILRVYIYDAFALAGVPFEKPQFEIYEQLAGEDKTEDLGVELFVDDCDFETPGEYVVSARFANGNYSAYPLNKNGNMFIEGGKLTLFATKFAVAASDGARFEIFVTAGYKNISARIELLKDNNELFSFVDFIKGSDTYTLLSAYRFIFEDEQGERVYPDGDYVITLLSVPQGAAYAVPDSYTSDEITEATQGEIGRAHV